MRVLAETSTETSMRVLAETMRVLAETSTPAQVAHLPNLTPVALESTADVGPDVNMKAYKNMMLP